jgi:serine/threonine protein kinase
MIRKRKLPIMGTTPNREVVVKTGDMVEGRYRIIKTLGAGGMGTVFLAEHALIKRKVAIKILHADLATDANVIERFMNEARAAGTLGHPNIVESTDMGFTHDHVPYIVYEYLEGTLLTDEIYRVGGLPVRRAVRVAEQIASALSAAHNAGIVHRDLKSDNVFLTDKDDALDLVKVLDFGVARMLEAPLLADVHQRNMIMGTPEFMAPEQITAPESVDKRADVYALGVILYEMLTARRPFSNQDDPRQLMHRIVNEEPPPLMRPEIPHALQSIIVDRMLAKDPVARYGSMADVAAALEQFLTRGDGTPLPRRRSQPIAVSQGAAQSHFDDSPETSLRLPKGQTPMPVAMRQTPWPVDTLDGTQGLSLGNVSLPAVAPPRRPVALYGIAAGGILMGALGLVFGLKNGDAPAPKAVAAETQQQPAATANQEPSKPGKIEVRLDSDIPNARVVFRRRVAQAPVTMEINASDVVELVEVSAPGYKTTRYWLTFDRATMLKAHLVKGTGNLEATEEETLVALGEVTMVKEKVAAAASAAAVTPAPRLTPAPVPTREPSDMSRAKTVEKPVVVASANQPTPRKIGRGAEVAMADESEVGAKTAEAPVPPPVAKDEPKVAEQTMPPTATPASATTETAKVEVAQPAKVAELPKTDVAPTQATPTPAPVIAVNKPAIDRATVSAVISTHRPEVLKCFAEGKKKNASMKGTISLQLQVAASGKVHRAQVRSTLNAPMVAACVVNAANAWAFPSRTGGEVATVEYPFTIN